MSRTRPKPPVATLGGLEREKAVSDALFLSIGEGAIVTDERGKIARVNQVALHILGYEAQELYGRWYPATIVAEDEDGQVIPNIERPITKVFLTGRPVSARVYYRRKDGTRLIVYLNVSPVILEGRPIGAIEVFRDITQEVELERAKDEFISLASHQLRTPATAVKQYAGMMLEGYAGELEPRQRAMTQTIYDCNERQLTIVNDLLKVAQVDAGKISLKPEIVEITTLVEAVLSEHESKFKTRSQHVRYQPGPAATFAEVDPQLLRMVIENIVDNASKYTPPGKQITVTLTKRGGTVGIQIRDQGVGIDKKDIHRVFQKFSRLPNALSSSVGGTGLGLYWAKKVVDLHGGSIKVASKAGNGSVFTIRVPVRQVPPEPSFIAQ